MKKEAQKNVEQLWQILNTRSFKKRGTAFFRIIGDGILQVVKIEYERVFSHHVIKVGLFSLYDALRPEWLSSRGCIPQYDAVNFVGERDCIKMTETEGVLSFAIISMQEQFNILENYVIPFLDGIHTQNELKNVLCKLNLINYGDNRINDMDMHQFAPCLYIGEYNQARKIVENYLLQNRIPKDKWSSKNKILEAMGNNINNERELTPEEIKLAEKGELVNNVTTDNAQKWLKKNYENNLQMLPFA